MWWLGPSNVTKDQKLTGFLTQVSRLLPRWMKQWEMQKKHWQNVSSCLFYTSHPYHKQHHFPKRSILHAWQCSKHAYSNSTKTNWKRGNNQKTAANGKSTKQNKKKNCYQQECKSYQRETNGWMACDWQKVKVLYELGLLGNFCYSSFVSSRIKLLRCPIKIRSKIYNSIDVVHLKCSLENGILFVWSLLLKLLYTWPRNSFRLFKLFHLLR